MSDQPFTLEIPAGEPHLEPQRLLFDSVEEAQAWAAAYGADRLDEERAKAARRTR